MGIFDSFMPGESYGIPSGGLLGGSYADRLNDPMLQIGLGILANNNTKNFGQVIGRGALQGIQQTQQARRYSEDEKYRQAQMKRYEREETDRINKDAAMQRLLKGQGGYQQMMDVPMETIQNVNAPAYENAPNFNMMQEKTMTNMPQSMFNQDSYNQDLVAAGFGDELIKSKIMPKQAELMIAPNGEVINKNDTSLIGKNFGKQDTPNLPSSIQEYEYAKAQGYRGSFRDYELASKRAGASSTSVTYGSPVAGVDANGNPIYFQPSKNGGAPSVIPGVAPPKVEPKAPTEMQAKAGTYYNQMTSASGELGTLETEGFDPTKIGTQFETSFAGGLGNVAVSPKAQQARQAQNQWAESFLRVKTGAAATKDEVSMNVKTFFPQVGDSKETITQKARARKQAENDVKLMASPSFQRNIIPKDEKMPKQSTISKGGWSAKKVP
jgi:hypothetical protein